MSVVAFERKQYDGEWSERELSTITAALNAALAPATGRAWETGMTEKGDAQFYLLGALPDQACELCVSRIGGRYLLEDGSGRLLFEHRNLDLVVLHAQSRGSLHIVADGARRSSCGARSAVCFTKGSSRCSPKARNCWCSGRRSSRLSPDFSTRFPDHLQILKVS